MVRRVTRKLKRKTRKQRGGSLQVRFGNRSINKPTSEKNFPKNVPRLNFKEPGLYTILMWDPDAPAKSWLHWLVVNAESGDVQQGEEVMPYAPPSPPSGTHTYYIGIYSQKGPLQVDAPTERGYFNPVNFIQDYNLIEVGRTSVQVFANEQKN